MARFVQNGTFKDGAGRAVDAGSITVLLAGTSNAATIYAASSGGSALAGGIVTTGSDGGFVFYVDEADHAFSQLFDIRLSKTGFVTKTYNNVRIVGKLVTPLSIVDADVSASAAIAQSKLVDIVNADVSASAAIAQSKLVDVVNADIAAGAAIVDTKLATISTAGKVSDSALSSNISLKNASNVMTGTNTNTAQPAFLAYNSSNDNNVTGDGTVATVDFDTEVFDQGSDFTADTFTAPVTGRYTLQLSVRIGGVTAAATNVVLNVVTSNNSYLKTWSDPGILIDFTLGFSVIADMDVSDTVTVTLTVSGEASNIVDIIGTSSRDTFFSGCLLV